MLPGQRRMMYPRSPWEKLPVNANAEYEMLLWFGYVPWRSPVLGTWSPVRLCWEVEPGRGDWLSPKCSALRNRLVDLYGWEGVCYKSYLSWIHLLCLTLWYPLAGHDPVRGLTPDSRFRTEALDLRSSKWELNEPLYLNKWPSLECSVIKTQNGQANNTGQGNWAIILCSKLFPSYSVTFYIGRLDLFIYVF